MFLVNLNTAGTSLTGIWGCTVLGANRARKPTRDGPLSQRARKTSRIRRIRGLHVVHVIGGMVTAHEIFGFFAGPSDDALNRKTNRRSGGLTPIANADMTSSPFAFLVFILIAP